MQRYILQRLIQAVGVIFLSSLIIFVATRVTADPLTLLLPEDATLEEEEALRHQLGLDQPIHVQYVNFVTGLLRGDFGISWVHHEPAIQLILNRLPASSELASAALVLSLVLSIPLGLIAGYLRGTGRGWLLEKIIMILSLLGISSPAFWLAIFAIFVFSVKLGWLPTSGRGGLAHLVMPVVILAIYPVASTTRLIRSGMVEVLSTDYIRTARAKGLGERLVVSRHVLKNVMIPVVTITGAHFGSMLVYATVIETIFAWPGVGRLLLQSMLMVDYPVLVVYGMLVALILSILNLIVDVSYAFFDPRITHE